VSSNNEQGSFTLVTLELFCILFCEEEKKSIL